MKLDIAAHWFKYRFAGVLMAIIIALGVGTFASTELDNSLKAWFASSDPFYRQYDDFQHLFEDGNCVVVILESETLFSMPVLKYIQNITTQLEDVSNVLRVHSLANANHVAAEADDEITIAPLLSDLRPETLAQINNKALNDELFSRSLVSESGRHTAVVVSLEQINSTDNKIAMTRIQDIVTASLPDNTRAHFSGDIRMTYEFDQFTRQNRIIFPLIVIPVLMIAIFITFYSFCRLASIMAVMLLSLVFCIGFNSLMGYNFDVITGLLIPLIIILSVSDSIHIIQYFDAKFDGSNTRDAFFYVVEEGVWPCFLTSITTSIGLLSLSISKVDSIKHFGITAAAGVFFAFFASLLIVPTLLVQFSKKTRNRGRWQLWPLLEKCLPQIHSKPYWIICFLALFFIASIIGATRIQVSSNPMNWFSKSSPFHVASMLLDQHLSGVGNLEVILNGPPDTFKNPAVLQQVDRLNHRISQLSGVRKVVSITDYIKMTHRAFNRNNPDFYMVPQTREEVVQELFCLSMSETGKDSVKRYLTSDYAQLRISVKTVYLPTDENLKLIETIQRLTGLQFGQSSVKHHSTGRLYLYNVLHKYILDSQIRGFGLAFALIIGFLFLAFRSIRYGAISAIANLTPLVGVLGIMGWFGIPINTGTAMVATVALGIAVDDTIHFISFFRKALNRGNGDVREALRKTFRVEGRACLFTSLINIAGFLTILVSGFQPTREFGLLVAMSLFFALLCDLIFLPALIRITTKTSELNILK